MEHSLLSDIVGERFQCHLVVRTQDVVDVLQNMLGVAHRVRFDGILKAYHSAMLLIIECSCVHLRCEPVLSTAKKR